MKIKCYDKYNKQHLVMDWGDDDSIYLSSTSSNYSSGSLLTYFRVDVEYYNAHPEEYAEDPSPSRWSDLTDFEIIK